MNHAAWIEEFPASITVCDAAGTIIAMNAKACKAFEQDGGAALIGKSVLDCHPEPARGKLAELLRSQSANCYTIEKEGARKLIYQSPWFENGVSRGLVQLSIPLPNEIPHFVRDKTP